MIIQVQISRAGQSTSCFHDATLGYQESTPVKAMMADAKRILSIINYISVIGQRLPYILVAQQ